MLKRPEAGRGEGGGGGKVHITGGSLRQVDIWPLSRKGSNSITLDLPESLLHDWSNSSIMSGTSV